MYKVTRSALVSHSARNMFNLVNDVESYSDFLPWCGESIELERSDTEVIASVMISYGGGSIFVCAFIGILGWLFLRACKLGAQQ